MELTLKRRWLTEASTVGELRVNGEFQCFILEDRYRPPPEAKVYGATAIPAGRYQVAITPSPRFKRDLPLLLQVPNYVGVRIHPGNTAADTEGCLLPGRVRHGDSVLESRLAFDALFERLKAASGPIWLTITVEPEVIHL
ncbi:MAG: DUF5675 family protein [Archangium sp.]|nr:DUF5675 family protein [Archangium sp.]